jgi:hypothetical protein
MPTARCSHLIAKAMHYKFDEVWIAQQPFLLVTYIMVYMPWFGRQILTNVLGPARIKALKTGAALYDLKNNFGVN